MKSSPFLDARQVLRALGFVLLGVFLYCTIVAPIFHEGDIFAIQLEKLTHIFLGWVGAVIVVGAVWLGVIYRKKGKLFD